MPEIIETHRNEVQSELNINFYDDADVAFHFNSGRDWESETTTEEREDGTTVEKSTICTIPCPDVSIYNRDDGLHAIMHLKNLPDPIIIAHLRSEKGESRQSFFNGLVASLESSYEGIDEVTEFTAEDTRLGEAVREALESGTPEEVSVPLASE